MTKMVVKAPPVIMPPRAAAYLEISRMRKEVFLLMFERHGNVNDAVDASYVAMAFIEDGETPDMQTESTRTSQPGDLPVDEAWAPGNAGKALADSGAESVRNDQEPRPAAEVHTQHDAGAGEQSGSPAELVRIGQKHYTQDQIDALRRAWADPTSTQSQIVDVLNVSWPTCMNVAARLRLGARLRTRSARAASVYSPNAITVTLDGAIDWYESQNEGRPVIPSRNFLGSFELGEGPDPAVITRNALIAEINALRRRKGEGAYTINTNGA